MSVCVKATVKGRVQGVGFRWFVQREARKLQVTGYVKNLYNGDVEALLEGPRADVKTLLQRIKAGPAYSHVEEVIEDWLESTGKYTAFSIDF